jgi:7-keto-8-aminopelargonate synthetase-like enzyme
MGLSDPRLVQCLTLAKAFATSGGLVLGSAETVETLRANAGAYTGSTAQPIALLATATAAIRWVERHPGRVRRLHSNLARFAGFTASLTRFSFDPRTPIGTWVTKDVDEAARLANALEKEGIHPPWIRYPGGPEAGFFRFAISAAHTTEDLATLARVLRSVDSGVPGQTG